jgi:hypothetical protein
MAQMKPQQTPRLAAAIRAPLASAALPWGEIFLCLAILAILTIGA